MSKTWKVIADNDLTHFAFDNRSNFDKYKEWLAVQRMSFNKPKRKDFKDENLEEE